MTAFTTMIGWRFRTGDSSFVLLDDGSKLIVGNPLPSTILANWDASVVAERGVVYETVVNKTTNVQCFTEYPSGTNNTLEVTVYTGNSKNGLFAAGERSRYSVLLPTLCKRPSELPGVQVTDATKKGIIIKSCPLYNTAGSMVVQAEAYDEADCSGTAFAFTVPLGASTQSLSVLECVMVAT